MWSAQFHEQKCVRCMKEMKDMTFSMVTIVSFCCTPLMSGQTADMVPPKQSPPHSQTREIQCSARSGKPRQAGKRQEDTGMNALHFGMRTRLSKSFNVSIEMGSFGSQNNRLGVAILDRNIKQIGPPPSARKN